MPEYEDVYEAPVLDATGQDMAAAIRELKGVIQPTNVCVDLDVSLEVGGWSDSAPYVYNWMNNKVTTECAVKVNYLEGAEDTDELYIGYEKFVGGIQFESPTKPTAAIPVRIHIVNAEADSITNIDDEMVSSDVISGASNVKQALTSLKNADATLSEQIETLNSKMSDLMIKVEGTEQSLTGMSSGEKRRVSGFTLTVPTGYKMVSVTAYISDSYINGTPTSVVPMLTGTITLSILFENFYNGSTGSFTAKLIASCVKV